MATEYLYVVTLERKDGTGDDLGTITQVGETYGEPDETAALTLAMEELVAVGTFYQWRNTLFLKTEMRSLRVRLQQMTDLDAALPDA